ncbi:MAG: recombinase family protein [Rhizobiales bacterium]|nr:recombinase family protein [Hyphomicrobiales bacterium]
MKSTMPQKAVIYCRVSGKKQVSGGDGLRSQETRCREYAAYKGYEVAEVFCDDVSGALKKRSGIMGVVKFLKAHRKENCVVVIDHIDRFARDVRGHWDLRDLLREAGGLLESPSIEFGEDADSILRENLLASVSQHHRQKNAEQTKNRMRARAMNGYWVFHAPIGYKYERVAGHGKLLVPNEPFASAVKDAFEGYAAGRYEGLTEVKRFLEAQPAFPRNSNNEVHIERVAECSPAPSMQATSRLRIGGCGWCLPSISHLSVSPHGRPCRIATSAMPRLRRAPISAMTSPSEGRCVAVCAPNL